MEARTICRVIRIALWIAVFAALAAPARAQLRPVRVLLKSWEGVRQVQVSAEAGLVLLSADGSRFSQAKPGESVSLTANAAGIVRPNAAPMAEVVVAPIAGSVSLVSEKKKASYRGWLRVTVVDGKLRLTNEVALESYLMSVVPAEMPSGFPQQALRAQAVAARTFMLKRMLTNAEKDFDLTDGEGAQTYAGTATEKPTTTEAVMATAGLVLTFAGDYCDTVYSADCGGHTAASDEMGFGGTTPYLCGTPDAPYCSTSPHRGWRVERTTEQWAQLAKKLGKDVGPVQSLAVTKVGPSGRAQSVSIQGPKGTLETTGAAIRKVLGYDVCKSTMFSAIQTPEGWVLVGNGWGHGVGLCQYGAAGRAIAGQSFEEILAAYYPGTELKKVLSDDRPALSVKP
ncbi:MAG: SpoIID/LytB domain-containing protein [Fimbriimonadia bacterium]|jgi:stage II sporulation protein D